jgi:hypothetical protein
MSSKWWLLDATGCWQSFRTSISKLLVGLTVVEFEMDRIIFLFIFRWLIFVSTLVDPWCNNWNFSNYATKVKLCGGWCYVTRTEKRSLFNPIKLLCLYLMHTIQKHFLENACVLKFGRNSKYMAPQSCVFPNATCQYPTTQRGLQIDDLDHVRQLTRSNNDSTMGRRQPSSYCYGPIVQG